MVEVIAAVASVLGIITGLWFLWDKVGAPFWQGISKNKKPNVSSLVLEKTPLFRNGVTVDLGWRTALVGDDAVGKTAITEWISALQDTSKLERWMFPSKTLPIIYSVVTSSKPSKVRVVIRKGEVTYSSGAVPVPDSPFPLKVFFIERRVFNTEGLDEACIISTHLRIPVVALQNYAGLVGKSFYCSISAIDFRKEGDCTNVYVEISDVNRRSVNRRYSLLSGSEQGRVLAELGIAAAQFASRKTPTMLVIESNSFSFDDARIDMYLNYFADTGFKFQTIIVSHDVNRDWKSWSVIELTGSPPTVEAHSQQAKGLTKRSSRPAVPSARPLSSQGNHEEFKV
ncbi:hypothetical protein [Nitrosomonas aestuarii]|uniref:hypothetical protein n=1 Tax=Nitrosomonas aestuarii TaxID=52441 RepID=UPI000D2F4F67|nr:hypothetical protein [Nitrosomonas aestuarii]PTN07286.1 hypothetical protein C8R11_1406 [Nitrosomonas aestuarii]